MGNHDAMKMRRAWDGERMGNAKGFILPRHLSSHLRLVRWFFSNVHGMVTFTSGLLASIPSGNLLWILISFPMKMIR